MVSRPVRAGVGVACALVVLSRWGAPPVAAGGAPPAVDVTTVTVEATHERQHMLGFGASFASLSADEGDHFSDALRHRVLEALFTDVHLTTGSLDAAVVETTEGGARRPADDPHHLDWTGFRTEAADGMAKFVLTRPEASAFHAFGLSQHLTTRDADQAAEQIVADLVYWRDHLHITPPYLFPFNEPTTGNHELKDGSPRDIAKIVKAAGRRLEAEGFADVKFVVPNEETDEASLATAQAVLSDKQARPFVGAIGYHPYPYGSPYASVPQILASADRGRLNKDRAAARRQLADLGARYGVPLWMTEVSHGDVDTRSFDDLRGRAIHIHDELEYANASAFFGMFAVWDTVRQKRHFGSLDNFWTEEGSVVLVDPDTGMVQITGIGYAMGHYARWLSAGAVRLEVTSSDPRLLVSAFRDAAAHRFVAVVINNAAESRTVALSLHGLGVAGPVTGEQSTAGHPWVARDLGSASTDGVTIEVPPQSVTTVAVAIASAPTGSA